MINTWFRNGLNTHVKRQRTIVERFIVNSFAEDVFNHQIWKQTASIPFQNELKKIVNESGMVKPKAKWFSQQ